MSGACPSDEQITELVEGVIGAPERRELEAHLSSCGSCRAIVAAAARGIAPTEPAAAEDGAAPVRADLALQPVAEAAYDVGRELARGGMGRILQAWDRRHGRPVAIKVLLRSGSAAMTKRFLREIQITARLQHPAIVPVYEAGIWPDGEPFFAMKLVAGRSLDEVVEASTTLAARLELLPNVMAITDALAYAHGHGVVHRDLKPTNVLIGAFGETVVIDWGLAKELGSDAEVPSGGDAGTDDALLTVAGSALGTPAYMPPEQARGEPVDARSDVYALGALLYHVLAGAPPYVGNSSQALVARVLSGPPERLALRAPGVAPDLVTLVEKAMARDRADRYATAGAMAADLKRWAEGRRVTAHSYSFMALLRRWVASHRAAVATGAVLLFVLAGGAIASVRRIVRERDRADQLAARAEAKQRAAVTRREAAENLTDYMVVDLRERLAAVGRLDLLVGVGNEVERYYRSVGDVDDAETPATVAHRAAALELTADVDSAKNDHAASRDRAAEAVALREHALALAPADREARARLAETLLRLASAESELTHGGAALATARRAADLASALSGEDASSRRFELLQASAEGALADQFANAGDTPAELEARRAARDTLLRVVAAASDDPDAKRRLGRAYGPLGYAEARSGRTDDALVSHRAALALFEELAGAHPDDAPLQALRADAARWNATDALLAGDLDESAFELFQRAAGILGRLVAQNPANDEWKRKRAQCLGGLVTVGLALGRLREARAAQLEATAIDEEVFARHPEGETAARMVALSYHDMARVALAEGNRAEALGYVRHALALLDKLLDRDPPRALWRRTRADMLETLARIELATGDTGLARTYARESEATLASLLAAAPGDDGLTGFIGSVRDFVGRVLLERGEIDAAREALEQSVLDFDQVERHQGSINGEWLPDAVDAGRVLAGLYVRAGSADKARDRLEATVRTLERADKVHPLRGARRAMLATARSDLARAGRGLGDGARSR